MYPPISPEKLAAIRALREGEAPTFVRLAAASGLHPATLRERSSRDNWKKPRTRRQAASDATEPDVLPPPGDGDADGAPAQGSGSGRDLPLDEIYRRYADVLPKQLARIIALAERGIIDKVRIDALISLGRVFERADALAGQQAAEKQKRSDDELAAMLARIDERIIELGKAYADELVAGEHRRGAD